MAIANDRLKQFFSAQKIGNFDALKKKNLTIPIVTPPLLEESKKKSRLDNKLSNPAVISREKPVSKPLEISEQPVSIPVESSERPVTNTITSRHQSDSAPLANPLANPAINDLNNAVLDLYIFSKKERSFLDFIFKQCSRNCSLVSPVISTEEIQELLKISTIRVRNIIFRIVKKGGIYVKKHKGGQSACRIFELPKVLYQSLLIEHNDKNKKANDPLANPLANNSSSSGFNVNNTTTTGDKGQIEIPVEWQEVDLTELTKRNVYFSLTHTIQLFPFLREYSAFDFQESIDGFVYDIDNKHVHAKKGLLNLFIGIIRNGGLYISSHYISEEKKLIKEMAGRSADMKKEKIEAQKETHRLAMREKIVQWAMNEYGAEKIEKELPPYLLADFKANGDAWVEYVYQYLYLKQTISPA